MSLSAFATRRGWLLHPAAVLPPEDTSLPSAPSVLTVVSTARSCFQREPDDDSCGVPLTVFELMLSTAQVISGSGAYRKEPQRRR